MKNGIEKTTMKKHVMVLLIVSTVIACSRTVYFINVLSSSSFASLVFKTFKLTDENLEVRVVLGWVGVQGSLVKVGYLVILHFSESNIDFFAFAGAARSPFLPKIAWLEAFLAIHSFLIFAQNFNLLLHSL